MITEDLHIHTTFCDGTNTPQEMVEAAIKKGLTCIGFSGHSHVSFDSGYCMKPNAKDYKQEIARLKEEYKNKIKILCGVEQDYYSEDLTDGYDYVIGSVHYIKMAETYITIDRTAQELIDGVNKFFDGDIYALCEAYYNTLADIVNKTNCDIIGHFDLITKFSDQVKLFDTSNPRYITAWQKAADILLKTGKVFEINTGAISRGYRKSPYPAEDIRNYLRKGGAKFCLSSDSHSANTLCYQFDKWEHELSL